MFSEMIEQLKKGTTPQAASLLPRLKAAIAKKSGVIRQPKMCWSSDPKINPDSTHMLWAAILVGDLELVEICTGIILVEEGNKAGAADSETLVRNKSAELLALVNDKNLKKTLQRKIDTARGKCR
jgi:hypothetical protein